MPTSYLFKLERGCTGHDSPVDCRELTKLKEHRRGKTVQWTVFHREPVGRKIHIYEKEHKNNKEITSTIFSCAYEYKYLRRRSRRQRRSSIYH